MTDDSPAPARTGGPDLLVEAATQAILAADAEWVLGPAPGADPITRGRALRMAERVVPVIEAAERERIVRWLEHRASQVPDVARSVFLEAAETLKERSDEEDTDRGR